MVENMQDNIDLLIDILLDQTAREDEREDAAAYLGDYIDEKALNALIKISSNPNENPMVLDTSGESIGIILVSRNELKTSVIEALAPLARRRLIDYISGHKPEWLKSIKLSDSNQDITS